MFTITFFRKKCFYILFPYRRQWCVKGQNICMYGVICFIVFDLIMQHNYFQKRKQLNLLSVSVRVKHLLIFYCTLLLFDMQQDHILKKKLILFLYGGFLAPGAEFKNIYIYLIWSSGGPFVQRSGTICAILVKDIFRNNSVKLF